MIPIASWYLESLETSGTFSMPIGNFKNSAASKILRKDSWKKYVCIERKGFNFRLLPSISPNKIPSVPISLNHISWSVIFHGKGKRDKENSRELDTIEGAYLTYNSLQNYSLN